MKLQDYIDHIQGRSYMSGVERNEARIKARQEIFTTKNLSQEGLDQISPSYLMDPDQPFVDPNCGDGELLGTILIAKLKNGIDFETALGSLYGVDIEPSNVEACRSRLLCNQHHLEHIVQNQIICHDSMSYDFSWNGTNKSNSELLFEKLFV